MAIKELYVYKIKAEVQNYSAMTFRIAAESREKAEAYFLEYAKDYYKTPTLDPAESVPCSIEILGVTRTEKEVLVNSPP